MSYATAQDLLGVMGPQVVAELSAEAGDEADFGILDAILTDASSIMDSYLGGRYVVPVTAAGALPLLRPWCLAIAKVLLLERRFAGRYDQVAQANYDKAMEWLKGVASSGTSLAGATSVAQAEDAGSDVGRGGSETAVFIGGTGGL